MAINAVQTISNPYLSGTVNLYKPNPSFTGVRLYDDAVRGTNLINKAAQLVNDLESSRNLPSFDTLISAKQTRPLIDATQYFETLLKDILAQLKETDKPLTVLNFIEARNDLNTEPEKELDVTA